MEKINSIIRLLNKYSDKEEVLCQKMKWFRLRCLLETESTDDNGNVTYAKADLLMEDFLSEILGEGINIEDENVVESLKTKNNNKELDREFYEFLSGIDSMSQEKVDNSWKKYAKVFIEKLNAYRGLGTLDDNIGIQLMEYAKKINNDPLRYIYELIQNADDCEYNRENKDGTQSLIEVKMVIKKDELEITYPEKGMTYSDIIAITTIGQSNKRKKKVKKIIGEKGRGFKTIFSVCDYAEIHSGPFHFKLSKDSFKIEWIDEENEGLGTKMILHDEKNEEPGTKMILHFSNDTKNIISTGATLFKEIKERYGYNKRSKENILRNCPIIFTNNIEKIIIEYGKESIIEDVKESIYMTKKLKTTNEGGIKKGELSVEYSNNCNLDCFWYEKKVKFTFEEYISHYKKVFTNECEFEDAEDEVKTYSIVMIAPKWEDGIKNWKGNMFTYLPTFTNIKAPISIQAPFELNEDRSCMWINGLKGDEHVESDFDNNKESGSYTTKWNRRLFTELFVDQIDNPSLIKYAYEQMVGNMISGKEIEIYDYIPAYQINDHFFFISQEEKYAECVEKMNSLCVKNKKNVVFDIFQNLGFFKRLFREERISCSDKPLFFDAAIDEILRELTDYEWLNACLREDNDNQKSEATYLAVIESIDLDKYENVKALGVKCVDDTTWADTGKVNFANELLERVYEKTIYELFKKDCSRYFPQKGKRKALKAIRMQVNNQKSLLSPRDAELWIYSLGDNVTSYNGEKLKTIPNESVNIKYEDIYSKDDDFCNVVENRWDNIWKYFYSVKGKIEKVNCSFELYKELIAYLYPEKDWYVITYELLSPTNKKEENQNNNEVVIPAEHIREIWKVNYKEYRGDILDGSKT